MVLKNMCQTHWYKIYFTRRFSLITRWYCKIIKFNIIMTESPSSINHINGITQSVAINNKNHGKQ